ncbi:MAG: hypothetical protein LH650_03010 [Chloroflexi bacterium]|nr:hypothetical protein [Chloroflexota bacterium]
MWQPRLCLSHHRLATHLGLRHGEGCGASDLSCSVHLSTADESATSPDDYGALDAQPVTFAPGETSSRVSIAVVADALTEDDETLRMMLTDSVTDDCQRRAHA